MILFQINVSFGQSPSSDTSKVLYYYEHGKSFYPRELDSLYHYYQLALDLSRSINYPKGEAIILRSRGVIKGLAGEVSQGVTDIQSAKTIIMENDLGADQLVSCFINEGAVYDRAVKLELAVDQYIQGEELARKAGLLARRTQLLNNIGIAYRRLGNYEDAIHIYKEALDIRTTNGDSAGMATLMMNISSAYGRLKNQSSALNYGKQAIDLYKMVGSSGDLLYAEANYGYILLEFEKLDEALEILERICAQDLTDFDLHQKITSFQSLAKVHHLMGSYTQSEKVLSNYADELEKSEFQELKQQAYYLRAVNNSALNNYKASAEYHDKHLQLVNAFNEEEKIKARQEMESKYLAIEKDLEIEIQNNQLEKSKRERFMLMIGILGLTLIAGLLFWMILLRKKTNRELDQKNQIISKALSEKDILLREIHHRVKNNLQFISSLLRLQSDHVSDPSALGALQQGHDRVRSMALIHQNLYQEENLTGVNTRDYFMKLITGLFSSNSIHEDRIKLVLNISELNLDVDTIVPIGLITNELITNSLKYAFPEGREGHIEVSLSESDGKLHLSISDDGIGMPDDAHESVGSSFGYKLINALIGQLDGVLSIDRSSGTAVNIEVKRYEVV